jgi:hypothetical protein
MRACAVAGPACVINLQHRSYMKVVDLRFQFFQQFVYSHYIELSTGIESVAHI